jgi:hypothetical protein
MHYLSKPKQTRRDGVGRGLTEDRPTPDTVPEDVVVPPKSFLARVALNHPPPLLDRVVSRTDPS